MYPNHPYGYHYLGEKNKIKQINQLSINNFHQKQSKTDPIVINIAGNIKEKNIDIIKKYLKNFSNLSSLKKTLKEKG